MFVLGLELLNMLGEVLYCLKGLLEEGFEDRLKGSFWLELLLVLLNMPSRGGDDCYC